MPTRLPTPSHSTHGPTGTPSGAARRGPSCLVQRVKRYVDTRIARIQSVQEVADALQVPEDRLCTRFRQIEGTSVAEYLRACRVSYLKLYLSTTELSSRQVARRVGFESEETANRTFSEDAGYTMTEFRELFRLEGTA